MVACVTDSIKTAEFQRFRDMRLRRHGRGICNSPSDGVQTRESGTEKYWDY